MSQFCSDAESCCAQEVLHAEVSFRLKKVLPSGARLSGHKGAGNSGRTSSLAISCYWALARASKRWRRWAEARSLAAACARPAAALSACASFSSWAALASCSLMAVCKRRTHSATASATLDMVQASAEACLGSALKPSGIQIL